MVAPKRNFVEELFRKAASVKHRDLLLALSQREVEQSDAPQLVRLPRNRTPLVYIGTAEQIRFWCRYLLREEVPELSFEFDSYVWKRQAKGLVRIIKRFLGGSAGADYPAMLWTHLHMVSTKRNLRTKHGVSVQTTAPKLKPLHRDEDFVLNFEESGGDPFEIYPNEIVWHYPEGTRPSCGFVQMQTFTYAPGFMYPYRETVGPSGLSSEFHDILHRGYLPAHVGRGTFDIDGMLEWSTLQILGVARLEPEVEKGTVVQALSKQLLFTLVPETGEVASIDSNKNVFNPLGRRGGWSVIIGCREWLNRRKQRT